MNYKELNDYILEHTYDGPLEKTKMDYRIHVDKYGKDPDNKTKQLERLLLYARLLNQQFEEECIQKYDILHRRRRSSSSTLFDAASNRFGFSTPISTPVSQENALYDKLKDIPDFNDLLNAYMEKGKIINDATLARKANLSKDAISRMRNGKTRPKRDYLWALSFALKLELHTEVVNLFLAADRNLFARKELDEKSMERETCIRYLLEKKIFNIDDVNIRLSENNMKPLGTKVRVEEVPNYN